MSQRRNALGRGLGALISNPTQRNDQARSHASASGAVARETQSSVDTEVVQSRSKSSLITPR